MRTLLNEFEALTHQGAFDGATTELPEHYQAALRYQEALLAADGDYLKAKHFYNEEAFSLFSDLLNYGNSHDLEKFYNCLEILITSSEVYDFGKIFSVNGGINSDSIESLLNEGFNHLSILLINKPELDANQIKSAINNGLSHICSERPMTASLCLSFIGFLLLERNFTTQDTKELLEGKARFLIQTPELKEHYLCLIGSLLQKNIEPKEALSLLTELLNSEIKFILSPTLFSQLLKILIKISNDTEITSTELSTAFSGLIPLIFHESQAEEYMHGMSALSPEKALAISIDFLRNLIQSNYLKESPDLIGVFLNLMNSLFTLGLDIPTGIRLLNESNPDEHRMSILLKHLMELIRQSNSPYLIGFLYEIINDSHLLANPDFRPLLKSLAQASIAGRTLKSIIFEYMKTSIPSPERMRLFQRIIDEHSLLKANSSAEVSPFTRFFSEPRNLLRPSSLERGTLRAIREAISTETSSSVCTTSASLFPPAPPRTPAKKITPKAADPDDPSGNSQVYGSITDKHL